MSQLTAISPKKLEELASKWVKIIKYQEFSIFIWSPRSEPIRRINEFLRDEDLQKKVGLNSKKTVFAILDFKDEPTIAKGELYADILWELSRELRDKGRLVEESDAMLLLKHLEKEGFRVVLITLGLNRMLERTDVSITKEIVTIYKRFRNVTVLNFLRIYLNPAIKKALSDELVFTANIFYEPIYSRKDCDQFIRFCEESWGFHITSTQREFILERYSGKLGTVKNALRIIRENPLISLSAIDRDPTIVDRGILTLSAFDPEVLKVVKKLQTGTYKKITEDETILDYLQNIGMAKIEKGVYWLYPPFLRDIKLEQLQPDVTGTTSPVTEVVNSFLTPQEQRVFKYALDNVGTIVARDRIAERMWESDVDEHYSDWAIDQLMYRLRGRLRQAKAPYTLKTKRGQGFILLDTR